MGRHTHLRIVWARAAAFPSLDISSDACNPPCPLKTCPVARDNISAPPPTRPIDSPHARVRSSQGSLVHTRSKDSNQSQLSIVRLLSLPPSPSHALALAPHAWNTMAHTHLWLACASARLVCARSPAWVRVCSWWSSARLTSSAAAWWLASSVAWECVCEWSPFMCAYPLRVSSLWGWEHAIADLSCQM